MKVHRVLVLRTVLGLAGLGLAGTVSPAAAGCDWSADWCWEQAHSAIYHKQNRIALLEANPYVDGSDKGPIIDHLHRKVLHIRAAIGPRWPHWPTPCCYSRRRIYIR